jgi:methylglutaconyl-CoA hydratase
MYRSILYAAGGGIARITLNRPEKRNALSPEMIAELKRALAEAERDDGVRVVLLTAAGKDFCSGADLESLERISHAGVAENLADARSLAELFLQMRRHSRPVIAAVHGRALAGGCGLAAACDIVLAAESARFGYPEVNLGFIPAMVMALLRRSVGEKAAFELMATGHAVSAARMAQLGVVQEVYSDSEFDPEGYAARLAAKPPGALASIKRLLYETDTLSFEAALEAGVHANAAARTTQECRRGVAEFLAKTRQPG